MPAAPALVECVPNVSEGRDQAVIDRLAATITRLGARLMNVHVDPDHHRSVFSFLGPPDVVGAAALGLVDETLKLVDMRGHRGVHPRLGALDVLPFVPLEHVAMDAVVALAREVGRTLGDRHRLPVYFYGQAALRDQCRRLPDARRGGYEALPARLATPDGRPDAGPSRFDERSGAILVGARAILVAYNVWLDSSDLDAARAIARAVRESSGGLAAVQAMAVTLGSRGLVQIALNLLDYRLSPIPVAFDTVRREAQRRGLGVRRAELVGVAPRAAFAGRSPASVGLTDFSDDLYLDTHVAAALRGQ